jgi:hypothetical protein
MEYEISIAGNKQYILITVKGEMDIDMTMRYTHESNDLGQAEGIDKFLTDLTQARNKLRVIQNYEFAYEKVAPDPHLNQNAKVALLVSPGDHSHDFVETVLINAGLNIRLFRNRQIAMDYLGVEAT